MLASALNSHPEILCPHEYWKRQEDWMYALTLLQQETHIQGKRTTVAHGQNRNFTDEMLRARYPIMLLHRADEVQGVLSSMYMGGAPEDEYVINPDSFRQVLNDRRRFMEHIWPHADFVVTYESLTCGQHADELDEWISHDICDFLEVSRQVLIPTTTKFTRRNPRNLDELRTLL